MTKRILTSIIVVLCSLSIVAQKYLGGDISLLSQYGKYYTPYYRYSGTVGANKMTSAQKVIEYMRDSCDMNSMRVRLFVNPTNANKDGVFQDLTYVTILGKAIKDAGLTFMLDFHYSDSWADPDHQTIPKAWYTGSLSSSNPSNTALNDTIYSYTKRCLEHLKANGATPDLVQIGNEISFGMLWRNNNDRCYSYSSSSVWKRFTTFLSKASKAVRETTPDAKIILHVERVGNTSNTPEMFYNIMKTNGVDYDIIGLSYYPFWHKSLENLDKTLTSLASAYPDKKVQIVETAYYYQYFPTNDSGYENTTSLWAGTPEGQAAFIDDLVTTLNKHANVNGLYYWCPEENGCGGSSYNASKIVINTWLNRGLWDNSTHKPLPALYRMRHFLDTEAKDVTISDITNLIDQYLANDGSITIADITSLIDKYLSQI